MNQLIIKIFLLLLTTICSAAQEISGTLAAANYTINQPTSYTIQILRYINPITGVFISPVTPAALNSYIQVVFPNDYIVISSETNPSCVNHASGATLACEVTEGNNTITIYNYYKDTSTLSNSQIEITISNIQNPSRAQETSNFEFYIKGPNNVILDNSPSATNPVFVLTMTFTFASFSSCSISANNNYISTRSRMTFSITPKNNIPADGKLTIDIPLKWSGDIENLNTVESTPTCVGVSGISGVISCSYAIFPSPVNIAKITVNSLSSSGLSSAFKIDISSILTPPFINSAQKIQIESIWSDGIVIDRCSSAVSDTQPIPFKSIVFESQTSKIVQSSFNGQLRVILAKPFYYQDQINIDVPSIFITNGQITVTSSNFAVFTTSVNSQTITLSNFPSSPTSLAINSLITFTFTAIKNPDSTEPISIKITFRRQSQNYQSSSQTYSATAATTLSIGLQNDNLAVNAVDNTVISLSDSAIYIPQNSVIKMEYHSSIAATSFSSKPVVRASIGGTVVENVQYQVQSNVLQINSIFAGGQTASNSLIQIEVDAFVNPPTNSPTVYNFKIYSPNGYLILSGSYTMIAALQTLISNTVTASSMQVMQTSVTYLVTFKSNYGFKAVSILIPSEITVVSGYESTCAPSTFTSCSLIGNNLTFIGTLAAGEHTLQWGSNVNPNSFKPTSSFSIFTYSSGWGVQKSSGYISITMKTQATLVSQQIKPNSYTNNQVTDIQVDFSVPSNSPTGTISVTVPTVIDIAGATCSLTTGQSCSIIPPKVTIAFSNPTPTPGLSAIRKIITIANSVNAPSRKPVQNFNLALVTADAYQSLSSSIAAWTNLYTSTFSTTVTSTDAYRLENAMFTFTITSLSAKQKYVNIIFNLLFGELTIAPTGATLINGHEVRYDIEGEGSTEKSFTLKTPEFTGDYYFTLKTYTQDGYLIGSSTTNVWRHTCYGTNCRSCYANNSCIDCYTQQISNYYIYSTSTKQCTRECDSGFYMVGTTCSPCSANCLECVDSSTTCTACTADKYLDAVYDVCVDTCSAEYFDNDLNKRCTSCVAPCLDCSSQASCLTCVQNFYLLGDQCLENCPAGVMVKYDSDRTCRACVDTCLTCLTYDYFCTSCDTDASLYLDNNECVTTCSTNRFVKNGVCSPCQLPCKICYDSTTTCSSCFANETYNLWFNYGCISAEQCAIGHFVNSVNLSCDACPSECEQCVSLLNCSSCAQSYYLYSDQCKTTCPNTTFKNEDDRTCDICLGCVTCSAQNQCTTCQIDQYLYGGQCYSVCPDSLFPTTDTTVGAVQKKICGECPSQCPTCISLILCKSCIATKLLYEGTCYDSCPQGSYKLSETLCQKCPTTCLTCTSSTNCLTCKSEYSLENSMCVLDCEKGISFEQICYPCGLHCQNCNDITCELCEPDYYLLNGVCIDNCSLSTLSLDGQTCVACTQKFINCTTCNQEQCLSCSDGQLTNGSCFPCSEGFYSRNSFCVACPAACVSCESATKCIECSDGFYIQEDFCTDTCPDNKIPNGTKCDFCIDNCSICDIETSMCSICFSGMYRFEGSCFSTCPQNYVVNLNRTVCITPEDYAEEYSQQSKKVYFPFTIATVIVFIVGIILNCYIKIMHLATFLVSVIAWIQLGSWILFGIIEYIFLMNLQTDGLKGLICVGVAIIMLIVTNFVFLRLYYKYFSDDMDFVKWQKSHFCINMVFVVFGTAFSFKIHRILYSKILDREEFSMVLSSVKKLIPISILSVISVFVSSAPIIVGSSLALYFSLNIDQQFLAALDCITVTGIMIILTLIDLKHPPNYFIDELETQNMKNKIYQEDDEKFEHECYEQGGLSEMDKNDGNMSKHNLLVGEKQEEYDNIKTAKKQFYRGGERADRTLRENENVGRNNDGSEIELQIDDDKNSERVSDDDDEPQDKGPKWIPKDFDHHGYLIKYDENGDPVKYDKHGHRIEIDEEGNHHKYDENGLQAKKDQNGVYQYYDKDGWRVDRETGKKYDQRGYQVRTNKQTDQIQFFDEHGYKIVTDPETHQQTKYNNEGYIVKIDPDTNQHKLYNEDGYEVVKENQQILYLDENGRYVRKNAKGEWQCYDPEDGFILRKNEKTGEYEKFDEHGFQIHKDRYGNIYRYEPETEYRVVIGANGEIKRYDDDGYLVKKDLQGKEHRYDEDGYEVVVENGEKIFYDEHGYRVERDFYGNPTLYDKDGNMVKIDKKTGKVSKYTPEGLQIIQNQDGTTYLRDKRGRKVVELEDGYYEKYDEVGNKIWLDEDGYEVEVDKDGNQNKYDKIGDLVSEDEDEEDIQFKLDEGEGDQAVGGVAIEKKEKKKERKKFKAAKQFDFEDEYKKMLLQENPGLIFEQDQEMEEENLKQFHDYEPPLERQLQREYNTLYEQEMGDQLHRNFSESSMKLENLTDLDNTPWANLKEKKVKEGGVKIPEQKEEEENKMTIDPENNLEKFQAKSVVDVSVGQRSFVNEGVITISQRDQTQNDDDELNSVEEIDTANFQKNKMVNKRSHASFAEQQQKMETKSENNLKASQNNIPVTIQNSNSNQKYKIYDSDEEVESLDEQEWQNDSNPNIFYKDKQFSNANTNTNDRGMEIQDQEDILSDYIPQQSIDYENRLNQGSQQNLKNRNFMQSIEQVEDEMFDRFKNQEDQMVKRSEFRLSGTPNPLLQYAKTIQTKKMLEAQKQKQSKRYKQYSRR